MMRTSTLSAMVMRRQVATIALRYTPALIIPSFSSSSLIPIRPFHACTALYRDQFNKDRAKNKVKKEKVLEAKKKGGMMKEKQSNIEHGNEIGVSVPQMEEKMKEYIEHMRASYAQIKAGRAVPAQLDEISCNAHGQQVPLKALATISARNAQTLVIQLYDPTLYKEVDKSIRNAQPNLNPYQEDGAVIVTFPKMTKEIRDGLVKDVHKRSEETRQHLRTVRTNYLQQLKGIQGSGDISEDLAKDLKHQIQTSHDVLVGEIKKLQDEKEKEIQQV